MFNERIVHRYKTAVHQCEVCKKEFKGKSSLEMHFRTHSGKETLLQPLGAITPLTLRRRSLAR